ncbi:hypothetical protein [Haloechinothrix aidingensis]|nr:hypothetical protein [Haloechinothrix aidingensis]
MCQIPPADLLFLVPGRLVTRAGNRLLGAAFFAGSATVISRTGNGLTV